MTCDTRSLTRTAAHLWTRERRSRDSRATRVRHIDLFSNNRSIKRWRRSANTLGLWCLFAAHLLVVLLKNQSWDELLKPTCHWFEHNEVLRGNVKFSCCCSAQLSLPKAAIVAVMGCEWLFVFLKTLIADQDYLLCEILRSVRSLLEM